MTYKEDDDIENLDNQDYYETLQAQRDYEAVIDEQGEDKYFFYMEDNVIGKHDCRVYTFKFMFQGRTEFLKNEQTYTIIGQKIQ